MILFPPAITAYEQPQQPQQPQSFRAIYDWGFASPSGEGKGSLVVLVEPPSGRVIIELHALSERLMLLEGNSGDGYRVLIPRNGVDESASSLRELPIPFMPTLRDAGGLARLLLEGIGPGVKAARKDNNGPKRLRWEGKDDKNEPCTVWLKRTRFERICN
ncbi:MAG: hypothetical protein LBQ86_03510 [Holophagales bacterium]|jgi:hypothetical protein|nr:hypothetical protein [Holophagales bacterium]